MWYSLVLLNYLRGSLVSVHTILDSPASSRNQPTTVSFQDGGNESADSYNEDDFNEEISKSKSRIKGSKTKRNRTNNGSKRRY